MAGRSKVPPTATSSKAEEQDDTGFILVDITPYKSTAIQSMGT